MQWNEYHNIIWNKVVLLKVSIFAWHLLRNRLPSKDNLVRCGIVHQKENVCVIVAVLWKTLIICFWDVKYLEAISY